MVEYKLLILVSARRKSLQVIKKKQIVDKVTKEKVDAPKPQKQSENEEAPSCSADPDFQYYISDGTLTLILLLLTVKDSCYMGFGLFLM